ncbi:hypothetical protein [Aquincola sp. J276]|nr:hypothetical protein [Aquincola sp. J276]
MDSAAVIAGPTPATVAAGTPDDARYAALAARDPASTAASSSA